jgi:hypothetical protein
LEYWQGIHDVVDRTRSTRTCATWRWSPERISYQYNVVESEGILRAPTICGCPRRSWCSSLFVGFLFLVLHVLLSFQLQHLFVARAIHTYSGQATLKPNLPNPQNHAIIYTTKTPPEELSYVAADGTVKREDLMKDPIRVNSELDGPEGNLGALSRINYSKIYTVEKDVRVLNIGIVSKECIPSLEADSPLKRASRIGKDGTRSRTRSKPSSRMLVAGNASSNPQGSDSEPNLLSNANMTSLSGKLNGRKHKPHSAHRSSR